jgi:hypothetical protein
MLETSKNQFLVTILPWVARITQPLTVQENAISYRNTHSYLTGPSALSQCDKTLITMNNDILSVRSVRRCHHEIPTYNLLTGHKC